MTLLTKEDHAAILKATKQFVPENESEVMYLFVLFFAQFSCFLRYAAK